MHPKENGTALIRGSLSRRFFILTLVLTRGERSDKGKKCSVLNFKKKLSLKHLVPQFQTIHPCLRSKIPIVTDTYFEPIWISWDCFYKNWNSSWWLMLSSRRKVVRVASSVTAELWNGALFFPVSSPAFLDPWWLWHSFSLGYRKVRTILRGLGGQRWPEGELLPPYCRPGLPAELSGEGDRQYMLRVFAKNAKGGEVCLYKTKQKPWEPFKKLHTF